MGLAEVQKLLRSYLAEICPLQRAVNISGPTAGELGSCREPRVSFQCGLGVRGSQASHPCARGWRSRNSRQGPTSSPTMGILRFAHRTCGGERVGTGPTAGETGPPIAAAVRATAANAVSIART